MKPILAWLLGTVPLLGADTDAFTVFRPVPRTQLRELSTDRPDLTESPYTVDAGHFQLEMDLLSWTRDHDRGIRTETLNIAALNLKLGLTSSTDLQMVFDSWSREHSRATPAITRQGMGDLTLRLKQNIWGNDAGTTALAVMPFVTLPLHASELGRDHAEAGVIIPLGWNLPHGLYLGVMTEWDWLNDERGGHRHAWLNTVTLGCELSRRIGGYIEFTATVFSDHAPWAGTIDAGLTYAWSANVQFDVGCNVGVTRAAPDVQPFIGLTYRY